MAIAKQCPECGGAVYKSQPIKAKGGYGPDLLPGLGKVFASATFMAVTCKGCGFTRFHASAEALEKLAGSDRWTRIT